MSENQASVFSAVDLWVFPSPRFSRWFTRLDWYLNWQMCKGLAYAGLHLPPETHRLADEYAVPLLAAPGVSQPPLLVAGLGRVPARRCLVLDGCEDFKSWVAQIKVQVKALHAQEIRVFLPTGVDLGEIKKYWAKQDCVAHFTMDLESAT
jgi:hypothetical protein